MRQHRSSSTAPRDDEPPAPGHRASPRPVSRREQRAELAFAQELKRQRQRVGLTQEKLADKIALSTSRYKQLERGRDHHRLTPPWFDKIANALEFEERHDAEGRRRLTQAYEHWEQSRLSEERHDLLERVLAWLAISSMPVRHAVRRVGQLPLRWRLIAGSVTALSLVLAIISMYDQITRLPEPAPTGRAVLNASSLTCSNTTSEASPGGRVPMIVSLPFPSTTGCVMTAHGARVQFHADASARLIRLAEVDILPVGGIAWPQQEFQVSARIELADPHDTTSDIGMIFLTPQQSWNHGGYLYTITPGTHMWRVRLIPAQGPPEPVLHGSIPLSVRFDKPIELAVQVHDGRLFPMLNGQWVGQSRILDPSVRIPIDRAAGIVINCHEGVTSAPMYVTTVNLSPLR